MKKVLLLVAVSTSLVFCTSAQNSRIWASYFGGSGEEFCNSITTDPWGNVYLAGYTSSGSGIATAGAFKTAKGAGNDAYLAKIDGAGNLLWATYYGGSDEDYGQGVKTDAAGNVYLIGYTYSTDSISTVGSYQPVLNGAGTSDAFIVKFTPNGTRIWATYYGGEGNEQGLGVATDAAGNFYITGETSSTTGIATPLSHQNTYAGGPYGYDGYLAKFDSNGFPVWATYYGGPDYDVANSVATDLSGNVFIGGYSLSTSGIASAGAFKTTMTGNPNAFIAKFNTGGVRQWGTYYGGTGTDLSYGICTDPSGNSFLTGITQYSNTGIASGGFQPAPGGDFDAYLVKFDPAGNRMWGTYYGGVNGEEGYGVATNAQGFVFLAGDTYSPNLLNCIATPNGFQQNITGTENHFLAVFTPGGVRVSSTYYGQQHEESAKVTVNTFGDVYLAGEAVSQAGIASAGFQNVYGGGPHDAFLVKFSPAVPRVEVIVPNDNLPPTPPLPPTGRPKKKYVIITLFHGGVINLSNGVLNNFSPGAPPPASGSSIMTFTCDFSGMYSNGGAPVAVACTATVKMNVTFASSSGPTRVFDTELLQLDLSGGTLPAGVMLRESPAHASPGQTLFTDIGGGEYRLSSFFDVFTELSTDGGNTWQPNHDSPARMEIQDDLSASIPTLGEWGLISLSILLLCSGIYFVRSAKVI